MSKILIIEDDAAIAELEKDYLELSDFEVAIESDGSSGAATRICLRSASLTFLPERHSAWNF